MDGENQITSLNSVLQGLELNRITSTFTEPIDHTLKVPHEVWIKIGTYLDPGSLCNLSAVNSRFYNICQDPVLWTNISILGDAISSTKTIITLLRRAYLLVDLSLKCRDDISDLLAAVAEHCKKIRKLKVRFCPILTYLDLKNLTENCLELEYLDLKCTGCLNQDEDRRVNDCFRYYSTGTNCFSGLLKNFKNLTYLNLFSCKPLVNIGLQEIADGCTSLTSLNIDEVNYLSDTSFIYFVDRVKDRLQELWIDGETFTDAAFSKLGEIKKLRVLSISFADSMQSAGLRSISRLSNLVWLKVGKGKLQSSDFVQMFSDMKLQKLKHLDLSECSKLSDLGLIMISLNCLKLKNLVLSWCWELTDVGVHSVVRHCSQLSHLNLCGVVK